MNGDDLAQPVSDVNDKSSVRDLRSQAVRVLRADWHSPFDAVHELFRTLTSQGVLEAAQASFNLAPTIVERRLTLSPGPPINSSTPTDLLTTPVVLRLRLKSVLLAVINIDWFTDATASRYDSYLRIDAQDYANQAAICDRPATPERYTATRFLCIPLRGGTHVIRWRARRVSGTGTGTPQATFSRIILVPTRFDNSNIVDDV